MGATSQQYMDELLTVYEEQKQRAEQVAREAAERYTSGEAGLEDVLTSTLETTRDHEYPVWRYGFDASVESGYSLHRMGRVLGYAIRDQVRAIPFRVLPAAEQETYIDRCADLDSILRGERTGFDGDGPESGLFSTQRESAQRHSAAASAYAAFDTLVFEREWIDYLAGTTTRRSGEPDWLTVLRTHGVGDASP